MLWLIVTVLTYFILALVALVDRYLLAGPMANPKVYSFYVGVLGLSVLVLIPFVGFSVPQPSQIILSLLAGAFFVIGLFLYYKAIGLFEVSRVVPAIGGILPILTLLLIYIFSGGRETTESLGLLSFVLLIFGSFLITFQKNKKISFASLKISIASAFFFALGFVLSKYVYLAQPFWSGYIWTKIGGFLVGASFLLSPVVRSELFKNKVSLPRKTAGVFLTNQVAGAGANILQNWGVALAPLAFVPLINALQGVQYALLFVFSIILSLKLPKLLKEEVSKETILQKVVALLFIGAGLALLTL